MISRKETCALLAGLSAGAVFAILYAPQSGKATRKAIGKAVEDAGTSVTKAGEYLRDHAERLNKEAQAALEKTGAQVEDALTKAGKTVTDTLHEANKTFAENLDRASKAISAAAGGCQRRLTATCTRSRRPIASNGALTLASLSK